MHASHLSLPSACFSSATSRRKECVQTSETTDVSEMKIDAVGAREESRICLVIKLLSDGFVEIDRR